MANKRRLTGYSGMRLDWPHVRSLESAVTHDFDELLRGLMIGLTEPYVVRGFRVRIPTASIPASELQIQVADAAVLHPRATEAGTLLYVPAGTPDEVLDSANPRVIGSFQDGVANYVSLDYIRKTDPDSVDQTAGWSASQKLEYQRTSPIGKILDYRFIISSGSYGGMLPLMEVGVSPQGTVTYITKSSNNLFRLGRGGSSPNPYYVFPWQNLSNTQPGSTDPRREWINQSPHLTPNPVTVVPGNPLEAFDYGDFSIRNLKEWMDAMMTRFVEITGSPYWYLNGGLLTPSPNLTNLWWDSVGNVMTGTGYLSYNLILESTVPVLGAYQSSFTDGTILPGDAYVEGAESGAKATLTSFNNNQLIVNSLTKAGFIFDETLYARRNYRMNHAHWRLEDHDDATNRLGHLFRKSYSVGASAAINSWSFSRNSKVIDNLFKSVNEIVCMVTFATAHEFSVGQVIQIDGTGLEPIDGQYFFIKEVPAADSIVFDVYHTPELNTAMGTVYDGFARILVEAPGHGFEVGDVVTVDGLEMDGGLNPPNGTFRVAGVIDPDGFSYYVARIPTGLPDLLMAPMAFKDSDIRHPFIPRFSISSWSYVDNNISVIVPSNNFKVGQKVLVSGLTFEGVGTDAPNGMYQITEIGPSVNEIQFLASDIPTGVPAVTATAAAMAENYSHFLAITGAVPETYNLANAFAYCVSDLELFYVIGPNTLPVIPPAIGAIEFDGVICESTVRNPIRVSGITNDGLGDIMVTTVDPHGLTNTPNTSFQIFGDPKHSIYIKTYNDINIITINPHQFTIENTGIISHEEYVNPGNVHSTFVKFANNPYPGPVAWDSDIIIKGVVGDKYFIIPQTAVCDGTITANQFNVSGQTGTAYLQDGEVAFVELIRNKIVSGGASYSTAGGGNNVVGATTPVGVDGLPLKAGDFVKWEHESESKWLRIAGVRGTPISGTVFTLVDDRGRVPTADHRPSAVGRLVYCKGTYDVVTVQPHWKVADSADIYWLAVRRDNESALSRVYLKALELEAGEVRQFNDNELSNHLIYTGAQRESAINPNYTVIDQVGAHRENEEVTVSRVDLVTRMVFFDTAPELGFQKEDLVTQGIYTWTIDQVLTSRTVIMRESVTNMANGAAVYKRVNYKINDQDNLTLAIRKEDRHLASVNTAISRTVYDESAYIQKIKVLIDHGSPGSAQKLRSGSFIYRGTIPQPTTLAWVLHGTEDTLETIEDSDVTMPGGHLSLLEGEAWDSGKTYAIGDVVTYADKDYQALTIHSDKIPTSYLGTDWNEVGYALIMHYSGAWHHEDAINQLGDYAGVKLENPGDNPFLAPPLAGGESNDGIELVLMPNRRTQVVGSEYVVYPTPLTYHASLDPIMAGEELFIITNDQPRQANVDYSETFGGPKGKIRLIRDLPPNTRLRARLLTAYGSAIASVQTTGVSLQTAYNGGNIVVQIAGRPVDLRSGSAATGGSALDITGSIRIDGAYGAGVPGGLFGMADKEFVIGDETNKPLNVWAGTDFVKTHDSHPGSGWRRFTASEVSTTDSATIVTNSEMVIQEGRAYRVKVRATARRSDGTFGVAGFTMEGVFYRKVGESVAAAGFPTTSILGFDGDGINYAMAFGVIGVGTLAVAVYGSSGATVQWVLAIDMQSVGTAA